MSIGDIKKTVNYHHLVEVLYLPLLQTKKILFWDNAVRLQDKLTRKMLGVEVTHLKVWVHSLGCTHRPRS